MSKSQTEPFFKRAYRRLPRSYTAALDLIQRRRFGGKARKPARLDVITSVGGEDADVLQVMLLSLSKAHPQDTIEFWLMHLTLTRVQVKELRNLNLNVVRVPDKDSFSQLSKLGGRPYGVRFLWMVAHQYLPAEVTRAIYLDPLDTLVTDDLYPFLMQPFFGKYLIACREAPHVPPLISPPLRKAHARGASDWKIKRLAHGTLNSGSIVINLRKFRRDGIDIGRYIAVGQWARDTLDLEFGDQGLYSMTHGSNYTRAHDRYNFRFFNASKRRAPYPAVIHYSGNIPKPFQFRPTPAQERQLARHQKETGEKKLNLNARQVYMARYAPYYRRWWEICAQTPVYARVAPVAEAYTAKMLAEMGLGEGAPQAKASSA